MNSITAPAVPDIKLQVDTAGTTVCATLLKAWVIAKKIGDDGIPGTNFFWETINSIAPLITKDIEESYLKDLNDQIDGNS